MNVRVSEMSWFICLNLMYLRYNTLVHFYAGNLSFYLGEECRDSMILIRNFFLLMLFLIYETTGVPITFAYNCKESGKIGAKCSVHIGKNLYHIYRERVLLEIVDDNGNQLENDKEGNIILTVLDRTTMPIIRYLTGDRGRILSRQCSCDRLSPLLELQGRNKDIILLPNGDTFSVLLFRSLFMKEIGLENITKYQIIQKTKNFIQIDFISRKNFSSDKLSIVQSTLESVLKNEIKIYIREVNRIENYPSGKNKVFISLLEIQKSQTI